MRWGVGDFFSPFFLAAALDIILSRTFLMLEAAAAALSRNGGDDVEESERGVKRCSGSSKKLSSRIGDDTRL